MTERRVLVIGSQCQALQHLAFLPSAAQELYAVMTDPERGACVPAIEEGGLLLDPDLEKAEDAIETAYRRAAKDEAALFIAYIGHGDHAQNDYYLLPRDAKRPPTSRTALHLSNLIKETHRTAAGQVDGLAILIDACYSGSAGYGAATAWVSELEGTLRFEVLTAAAADRPAADGCFSRALARLLREGVSEVPAEHLRCADLRSRIAQSCPNQVPQNPAYNPDETLWLAKNGGHVRHPWAQTALADQIERLTRAYQMTPALEDVVVRSQAQQCVAVVGAAGTGKSALIAALAWPEVAGGVVPANFVQAAAFLTEATTPQELARTLVEQLTRSVPHFRQAQRMFAQQTPDAEQRRLGILERQVIGPLGRLPPESDVRLVIDALDRLATGARGPVMDALNELAGLPLSRLIVTARPETLLPNDSAPADLSPASPEAVAEYLERRAIVQARRGEIVTIAGGNWLVARVLADLLSEDPSAEIRAGQPLRDAYEELLSRCNAHSNNDTQVILSVLAAAGAGPLLPLKLMCAVSEKLEGPVTEAGVRDELFRLRGLVVRSSAGTEREHAGLFHDTLVTHVVGHTSQTVLAAHRALANCIRLLAPPDTPQAGMDDPIQRYAFEREAEHLWALDDPYATLRSLQERKSAIPRDNLRRWRLWEPRLKNHLGPDHPITLGARSNIASWTGQCGDVREALRLLEALLPDLERVLGPDHPNTLATRNNIAYWTGQRGDAQEALRLSKALLPDLERVLGPDDPATLATRHSIAYWTGQRGDAQEALRLSKALLPDRERVLGPNHPDMLNTRHNIAGWTGQSGNAREALRLSKALLPDQERVLGPDHPDTLAARNNIAYWTGQRGDAQEALRLFKALLPDLERVLGPDHPDTLGARHNIAGWTGQSGNAREALRLSKALLPDRERVLGPDHPDTLTTRNNIGSWTGQCGNAREALRLFKALLPVLERVCGADHPDTLTARNNIGSWTGRCGDAQEALRLFKALLPDRERVLGPDHPDTLTTREWIRHLRNGPKR